MSTAGATTGFLHSCPLRTDGDFVPLAIQNFLQQDYPNRELVILDDGQDSIADLTPADARVKYIRTTQRQTVGAKRNQCVQASQGNLIMHWMTMTGLRPTAFAIRWRHCFANERKSAVCGRCCSMT